MYGLVNAAIADLAREIGGDAAWQAIREEAGLVESSFVGMTAYPDELTYDLVAAAGKVLQMSQDEVLRAFGRHWVRYTGRKGWGPLLEAAGTTMPEVLGQLDALHCRVRLMLPELRPPSFRCTDVTASSLRLRYYSHRAGLAPMVVGLVEGLAELLDVEASAEAVDRVVDADAECVEFLVCYAPLRARV